MEINKIYNQHCLDTMSLIPDNFVDMALTSPPYNMMTQVKYNKYIKRVSNTHKSNKYISFDDGLKIEEFYNQHSKILKELLRVSKIVLYNFQIVSGSKEAFFKIIGDFNRHIKDIIIWDKGNCLPASREKILNAGYEMILILENDESLGRTITNAKFKRCELDNIIRVKRNKFMIDNVKHNAAFPEELVELLVRSFSNEGDLIYDPFMGTGTVAKVSKLNNRNYIGSEIEKQYCEIIEKRLNGTEKLTNA